MLQVTVWQVCGQLHGGLTARKVAVFLHCECPLMALNCRDGEQMSRQLSGVKRTRHGTSRAAVIDPKRTCDRAKSHPFRTFRSPRLTASSLNSQTASAASSSERFHFGFDDGDGFFNPASRAFTALRFSAYSLPSIGATCGGSLSRYGRPIPSSFSFASIHFHNISLHMHLSARVSPFTLTRSTASPWP